MVDMEQSFRKEERTGITFNTYSTPVMPGGVGAFSFGLLLPQDALKQDATEYIGYLQCQTLSLEQQGWCGIAHAGHMALDLLLMAWPHEGRVLTSFREAWTYMPPTPFDTTSAVLTDLASWVTPTGFGLVYRCQNCFEWELPAFAYNESVRTSAAAEEQGFIWGYAQGARGPTNAGCPAQIAMEFHNNGFGQWDADVANSTSKEYARWAAMAGRPQSAQVTSCAPVTASSTSAPPARRTVS